MENGEQYWGETNEEAGQHFKRSRFSLRALRLCGEITIFSGGRYWI